jgi:hypothetical protein
MTERNKQKPVLDIVQFDPLFIAREVQAMKKFEVGYIMKDAVGPDKRKQPGVQNALFVDGHNTVFTAVDLRTLEDDGGVMEEFEDHTDYLRVICLGKRVVRLSNAKTKKTKAYAIDAAHLNYGEDVLVQNKLEAIDWDKEKHATPLPVVRFVATTLDLDRFAHEFKEQSGFALPESELLKMSAG